MKGNRLEKRLRDKGFTDFQVRVLMETSRIPYGRVISYKEMASRVGCKNGARAVANVLGRNPFRGYIPCHRVIRSNGEYGGYRWGKDEKRRLIESEIRRKYKTTKGWCEDERAS